MKFNGKSVFDSSVIRPHGHCDFSACRQWRYTLWRRWALEDLLVGPEVGNSSETRTHEYLMVVGLNPSTADEQKDDPTIRKCIGFAKRWGFGALCMTNIFAWRDTDPNKMKRVEEPVGAENNDWLRRCAADAGMVLGAWGKHGDHLKRNQYIRGIIGRDIYCLRKNKDGSPMHPLYVSYETIPILL